MDRVDRHLLLHIFKLFAFALPGEKGSCTILDQTSFTLVKTSDIWMHEILRRELCTGLLGWCRCRACGALLHLLCRRSKLEKLLGGGAGIRLCIMEGDVGLEGAGGVEWRGRKVLERRGIFRFEGEV